MTPTTARVNGNWMAIGDLVLYTPTQEPAEILDFRFDGGMVVSVGLQLDGRQVQAAPYQVKPEATE